jgi:uncharacterized protein (DUF697 family)
MSDSDEVGPDQTVERAVAAAAVAERMTNDVEAALRREQAENLIKKHVLAAAALSLVPLAILDIAAMVVNQIAMARGLAQCYDVPFDELRARTVVISLLAGSAPTLSVMALSSSAKLIPGIGTLFGSGTIGVTGGAATYALGRVLIRHFEGGGTLLSLDLKRLRECFRAELRRGREVAAAADRSGGGHPSADGVRAAG